MVTLDIETPNLLDKTLPHNQALKKMRFGIAVTYDDDADNWREWGVEELPDLWTYLKDDMVGGFNITGFDIPVIMYSMWRMGLACDGQLHSHDLFAVIKQKTGRWYGVDGLAGANLNRQKSGSGLDAAAWLEEYERTGDQTLLRKTFDYCHIDVEIEYGLYAHLMSGKPLLLPPLPKKNITQALYFYLDGRVVEI